ncbi:type IV pilus assembly protein PilM [bacterium]|nr:type IV pilus assembly protein PilM [bacterium]
MKNAFVGLDIGFDSIKLVEITRGKSGLEITNFIVEPCEIKDLKSHGDDVLIETVKKLFISNRIKPESLVISISGQSVFTRFVKLPTLDKSKIDQIVQYEAQQQVPFPIDEVIWDYQLLGDWNDVGDIDEANIVLVASKKEIINNLIACFQQLKIDVEYIDISPFSICNCIRFNETMLEGLTLLLDIGAKSTDMVLIENENVWVRSIPIGGFAITNSIAKEFKINFQEAEKLKRESAVVLCGDGPMVAETPERRRISRAIVNTMSRLLAEISRSIGFYRTYSGGGGVHNILITGGSSEIENIEKYFFSKLKINVSKLNTIRNLDIKPVLESRISPYKNVLGASVGLALRKATKCFMEISLLPKRVATQRDLARKKGYVIGCFLALALFFAAGMLYFNQWIDYNNHIKKSLELDLKHYKAQKSKIQSALKKVHSAKNKLDSIKKFQDTRTYWSRLFNELQIVLPKDCWLKRFLVRELRGRGKKQFTVQICGETTAPLADISLIKIELEKSSFFKDVEIKSADDLSTTGINAEDLRRFVMVCKLKGL